MEIVDKYGFVSTEALVKLLRVSAQTVRKDLNKLAERKLVNRNHGGASTTSYLDKAPYADRNLAEISEKCLLAQKVVEEIEAGSSIYLDIGTTCEAVATSLVSTQKAYTVLTNNIKAASIISDSSLIRCYVLGGELRMSDGGIVGDMVLEHLDRFSIDYSILSIGAVDVEANALLDYDYEEIRIKNFVMDNSAHVILPVTQSKFTTRASIKAGSMDKINTFVVTSWPTHLTNQYRSRVSYAAGS